MTIYLGKFASKADLLEDFLISEAALKPYEILLAFYEYGDAFVLLRRKSDGALFEVNGAHCSCCGLEDQWIPKETTKEALLHRLEEGALGTAWEYFGDWIDVFASPLKQILAEVRGES